MTACWVLQPLNALHCTAQQAATKVPHNAPPTCVFEYHPLIASPELVFINQSMMDFPFFVRLLFHLNQYIVIIKVFILVSF